MARVVHLFEDRLRQAKERVGAMVANNGKSAEVVPLRKEGRDGTA